MRKLNKLIAILVSIIMLVCCITACSGEDTTQNTSSTEGGEVTEVEITEGEEPGEEVEEIGSVHIIESLQEIADLNGCNVEDLNCAEDSEGFICFLGAPYTDEKITNSNEAFASIEMLKNLAGLEDCEFAFYREDVSPVTGFTYYIFSQVASSANEDMPIKYTNSQVRVITDSEGNSRGFSADIIAPDSIVPVDADNFVEKSEAEYVVQQALSGGSRIINEMTELTYWDDSATAASVTNAKVIPVWTIYTNESRENKPYTMYIVAATRGYDDEVVISDKVAVSTLNVEDDTYTSQMFFEGMEDAGEVTYDLDMTWAFDAGTGYQADEVIEVTVPIMMDSQTGLYYLADYNEKLVISNYLDFTLNQEVNAVVSEDPSDIYSWHFASMEGPNGEQYFCNPNYLIASYDTMEKAYGIYKNRYGYNSVDTSGMPMLLLAYEFSGDYPTDVSEFMQNANNMGQWHDWAVFGVSPTFTGCVEVGTMTHEFAHGINGQLTSTRYHNEMGAVMEGYADSIGEPLAHMYGYKNEAYADYVGSEFCEPMRSFRNPYEFQNPKYIGGMYYVNPVSDVLTSDFDNGGVHSNSSVVNYLCYCLSHSDDESAAVLDEGTNVDLFVETLYCATYNSDFRLLGSYLLFAAMNVDMTEDQLVYVYNTLNSLGFLGDRTYVEQLIAEEDAVTIAYSLNVPEEINGDLIFGASLTDGETEIIMGQFDEDGNLSSLVPADGEYQTTIMPVEAQYGTTLGAFVIDVSTPNEQMPLTVEFMEAALGQELSFDGTIVYATLFDPEAGDYAPIEEIMGSSDMVCGAQGYFCITVYDEEGYPSFILISVS
ncbi:MAG: M4 family metallopeptidase [Lachnospiraceae bacterium]|nr:M4 family metallopeptidase [Lachnospiraceae bacterium]